MQGYDCRGCGQHHDELPFSYWAEAPAYWDEFATDEHSVLGPENCVIAGEQFFIRGRLVIPVIDGGSVEGASPEFDWGVWVSLSERNYERTTELWTTPGRESEPPYFGWLCTELPLYEPSTLGLKTHVHTQPVGERPTIELEPSDHPLAVEQRTGITAARVQEIAERFMHP
jgi:hypothetical protein